MNESALENFRSAAKIWLDQEEREARERATEARMMAIEAIEEGETGLVVTGGRYRYPQQLFWGWP